MNIEDLMIGDWVSNEDRTIIRKVTGVDSIKNRVELEDYTIDAEFIYPILLTSEILEKNGFKKDIELNGCYWRPDCRKYCIVKEIDTWYFAFRHMGGGHICIFECNYVHELQCALKSCKIKKKVIL